MGKVPFSERLDKASCLSEVFSLSEEIKNLLLAMMKTDKRSLKQELQKTIFRAKLNLYCELYKKARVKFLEVQKKEGANMHYKEPLTFEKLMRDFNWQKTVNYSIPIRRDEVEIDTMVDSLYEDNYGDEDLEIIEKSKKMKPLFNRNEQDVIDSALSLTLVEFLEKYEDTSADEKVLKTAYHEIRAQKSGSNADKVVTERVGEETENDVLDAKSPTATEIPFSANEDYPFGAEVEFKFATGEVLIGKIIDSTIFEKITVEVIENKKSTKYPISIENVIEIISLPEKVNFSKPKVEKKMVEKKVVEKKEVEKKQPVVAKQTQTVESPSTGEKLIFKNLDKENKLSLVQELYDSGLKTTGEIKKKLAESYVINHYDDVYNVFVKIKK